MECNLVESSVAKGRKVGNLEVEKQIAETFNSMQSKELKIIVKDKQKMIDYTF